MDVIPKVQDNQNLVVPSIQPFESEIVCVFEDALPEEKKSGFVTTLLSSYLQLWKSKLSVMVVITSLGAYLVTKQTLDMKALYLSIGTFLQAGCANSINEIMEVERDKKMNRTMGRPLCVGKIGKVHAAIQAVVVGTAGTYIIHRLVDPKTALLGLSNILIYDFMYTPMKPVHWINTWIGSINGCIPPLMGSVAASGDFCSDTAIYMFTTMYLWQISHFMAIGYKCRTDYKNGGYEMLPISNARVAAQQSMIHAWLFFPLLWYYSYKKVLPVPFTMFASYVNYIWLYEPSLEFLNNIDEKDSTEKANSLFWGSLKHLGVLFGAQAVAFCWEPLKNRVLSWFE
jgi:protoheme IX farnesyltransferase